jgi:hypothetical protein
MPTLSEMLMGGGMGAQEATPAQVPLGVLEQARKQYPILNDVPLAYKESPGAGNGRMLESWPPGEPGDEKYPRPKEFPIDQLGVENFSDKTRPIDILGDVVSHHLLKTDPTVQGIYSAFERSVTPSQEGLLKEQFKYAQQNLGEERDFDTWKEISGLPALFRGHPFQQWPNDFNERVYTPQQRQLLDKMMSYLQQSRQK